MEFTVYDERMTQDDVALRLARQVTDAVAAGDHAEAVRLTRELEAVGWFENTTDYAELIADFFGPFHDLRDVGETLVLRDDPAVAYPEGQKLARQLRADHASNGIIYPSVRHHGGTCLLCFRPDLVQNLRQGSAWRLEWRGTPKPAVTRQGQ